MELDEKDLDIDLNNIYDTSNPKQIINNYFNLLRQEIDSYSDKYLNERTCNKNNNNNNNKNEDRLEITFKRDKMISQIDLFETQCFNSKSERQFVKLSTNFNYMFDKLTKISTDLLSRVDLNNTNSNNNNNNNSSSQQQHQVKNDLFDLKKELFINRTIFFVRNLNLNSKSNQFGNLIVLDFYLDDFEVLNLK